jgi:hypothetical protein
MWGGTFLGLHWGKWIALVALAATLGPLNGWIMLTARMSLAGGRRRPLPGVVRARAPHAAHARVRAARWMTPLGA